MKYSYSKVGPLSLGFMQLVPMFAERPPFWNKVYERGKKWTEHAGHANPKKYRTRYTFLSFYSVILKLGPKKELVIL